jgi:hypothetical protein
MSQRLPRSTACANSSAIRLLAHWAGALALGAGRSIARSMRQRHLVRCLDRQPARWAMAHVCASDVQGTTSDNVARSRSAATQSIPDRSIDRGHTAQAYRLDQ